MQIALVILAVMLGVMFAGTLGVFVIMGLVKVAGLVGRLIAHVFRHLAGIVADAFRALGALLVALILAPITVANVAIGRWSAAAHFGRALQHELSTAGLCLYRVLLSHPAHLIGLGHALEGVEGRLPRALSEAPGRDRPSKANGLFEGYTVIASLPGGGSGGRLYVAQPTDLKQAALTRRLGSPVHRVVIKSFSLRDGSSLPQIVRESRALDAARRLGLVLEHDMSPERFFYVMKYVPGENLAAVTQRLHARSAPHSPPGLDATRLKEGLGYLSDLLETLSTYHQGGLWHKDVKPENIIIDPTDHAQGRAHLVDFGLVTPLRSAMTLTTHGTEYYRDPEMVRQALKGAKVHQIDGARFDIYAAGAVLYQLIEGQFPAHGGLSQVTRRCPESVRWIIRRAMTDYEKRYPTAGAMLDDLRTVLHAHDPFALRPIDLPSMASSPAPAPDPDAPLNDTFPDDHLDQAATPALAPLQTPALAPAQPAPGRIDPARIRVTRWWSGGYQLDPEHQPAALTPEPMPTVIPAVRPEPVAPAPTPSPRPSAAEQRRHARQRVANRQAAVRAAAHRHMARHANAWAGGRTRGPGSHHPSGLNLGIALAVFVVISGAGGAFFLLRGAEVARINNTPVTLNPDNPFEFQVHLSPTLTTTHAHPDIAPAPDRGPILILSDHARPLDPTLQALLDQLLGDLARLGYEPRGELGPLADDGDELIARLRVARGLRTLGDETTRDHALALVTPAQTDLLWLAPLPTPGPNGQPGIEALYVVRPTADGPALSQLLHETQTSLRQAVATTIHNTAPAPALAPQ